MYFIYSTNNNGVDKKPNRICKFFNELTITFDNNYSLYVIPDGKYMRLVNSDEEELDTSNFSIIVYTDNMRYKKWSIIDLWENWAYVFRDAYNLHNVWSYVDIYIMTHAKNITKTNLNRLNLTGKIISCNSDNDDGYYKVRTETEVIPFRLKDDIQPNKFFAGLSKALLRR